MKETQQASVSYEFGPFLLTSEPARRLFMQDDAGALLAEVSPTEKEYAILLALLRGGGRAVGKDKLMDAVWPDTYVEEGNLAVHVSALRKKLGRVEGGPAYIENEPRRGYRFTAPVREVRGEELFLRRHTRTRVVSRQTEESSDVNTSAAPDDRVTPTGGTPLPRVRSKGALLMGATTLAAMALVVAVISFTPGRDARRRGGTAAAAVSVKSLAVLPFALINVEGDEGEYLGLGMADALITRLGNVRQITVRPTSAVRKFTEPGRDAATTGRQLGVEAVLEGNIQKAGDRVRITAQLMRVSDGAPLWGGTFEESAKNVFALQDAISEQLVAALALNLSGDERAALTRRYTESADAFRLYAKGRYHWNKRNAEGMTNAEKFFRQAIDRDPNFALAYVGLADTLAMNQGNSTEFDHASGRALALDPNLGEVYATRGFIEMFHNWRWRKAEQELRRAVELSPKYGTAHQWLATLLAITGRVGEAKIAMRRALEIDPLSPNFLADMGQMHYFAREYEEAEHYCRRALEVSPDFNFAHGCLMQIYLKTNRHDEAFAESLRAITAGFFDSKYPNAIEGHLIYFREIYRRSGMRGVWREWIEDNKPTASAPNVLYGIAINYALLGEREEALHWLEKAVERRPFMMAFVGTEPYFDDLRSEPRFQAVLRRMNLPSSSQ